MPTHTEPTYGADTPYKSDRQRRAMHAAARGSSKFGIPKSVGMSYASHGMKPKPRMNGLMPKRMKELKPCWSSSRSQASS